MITRCALPTLTWGVERWTLSVCFPAWLELKFGASSSIAALKAKTLFA